MYITKKGDTWDLIALKTLGDEKRINEIVDINTKYIDVVIFDAGIQINVPEMANSNISVLPEWRK